MTTTNVIDKFAARKINVQFLKDYFSQKINNNFSPIYIDVLHLSYVCICFLPKLMTIILQTMI